jgi:hypothetical protein
MNFKTLNASILALLVMSAPAAANPNEKVFGRSNGGSEIALDTNSFNQSENFAQWCSKKESVPADARESWNQRLSKS